MGALFLPPSRHRIVEGGYDSARFYRFTMAVMGFALVPFAAALALDLAVAGDRILGPLGGAACGAIAGAAALAFWYGHFARPVRRKHAPEEDSVENTPLDHRIVEVLLEARVVLPGAQALLGFQLAMVTMDGRATRQTTSPAAGSVKSFLGQGKELTTSILVLIKFTCLGSFSFSFPGAAGDDPARAANRSIRGPA